MAVLPVQTEERTRVWEQVLQALKNRLPSHQAFDTWFRPIAPRALSPQLVELEVPNAFFVDWIHEHHLTALRSALVDVFGACPEIRFTPCEPALAPGAAEPRSAATAGAAAPRPAARRAGGPALPRDTRPWFESQLHPRLTFESFVVGPSNRFTHAASRAVSERPGEIYNPLFIFGGSGLGKTHLLHAIGHEVKRARPEAQVSYVPAERFTNEMIFAIQYGQTLPFRNRYRNVDVLLIDDVQFLAGKESTQEEFFYTFNALRDAHKQIVVTADKAPKDIDALEERLISRFNQGLIADIQQPDLETRIAILRNRCHQEGTELRLPDDVLLLIADRVRANVRDLEGCLVRLLAVASLTGRDVTLELANEVIAQYVDAEPDHLTPERILAAVTEKFNVRADALLGKRRTQNLALPRQVAMYLMRQLTDMSLVEIGRFFGGRDHTTVLYACERVAERIATDEAFREKINALISTLASG